MSEETFVSKGINIVSAQNGFIVEVQGSGGWGSKSIDYIAKDEKEVLKVVSDLLSKLVPTQRVDFLEEDDE